MATPYPGPEAQKEQPAPENIDAWFKQVSFWFVYLFYFSPDVTYLALRHGINKLLPGGLGIIPLDTGSTPATRACFMSISEANPGLASKLSCPNGVSIVAILHLADSPISDS